MTGFDGQGHRPGHGMSVVGASDGRGQKHRGAPEFHCQSRIRGGADAGVEDDGHLRTGDDGFDVVGIEDASPLPIGAPAGITTATPASSRRFARAGSSFV